MEGGKSWKGCIWVWRFFEPFRQEMVLVTSKQGQRFQREDMAGGIARRINTDESPC